MPAFSIHISLVEISGIKATGSVALFKESPLQMMVFDAQCFIIYMSMALGMQTVAKIPIRSHIHIVVYPKFRIHPLRVD